MKLFDIHHKCPHSQARAAILTTAHGLIETPAFMPLATQGSVKTLSPDDLKSIDAQIILGNTYHLYLRPGMDVIKQFGGLHQFMAWDGPMLTDSGGFQVFSLGHLRKISDAGAIFTSHIDGSSHLISPEVAMEIQQDLGADIIMAFDQCVPVDDTQATVREAMERTHRWAERCKEKHGRRDQALFGIVQGGDSKELREESVEFLTSLDFPGYSIGGLSVGEPKETLYSIAQYTASLLPTEKPRYLMGVGSPEDLVECVSYGIDMFDCALPTRIARNGALFTNSGRVNIRNSRFKMEPGPVDTECDCYTCRTFSASYLHHLFKCRELFGYRLATLHNLRFVIKLMRKIRQTIVAGSFDKFRQKFLAGYQTCDDEVRLTQKQKWLKSMRAKQ